MIHLLIDTSVLVAHVTGTTPDRERISELLDLVEEEGPVGVVGVPVGCVPAAEAVLAGAEPAELAHWLDNTHVIAVLPMLGPDGHLAAQYAASHRTGTDTGHVLLEMSRHPHTPVATFAPGPLLAALTAMGQDTDRILDLNEK